MIGSNPPKISTRHMELKLWGSYLVQSATFIIKGLFIGISNLKIFCLIVRI